MASRPVKREVYYYPTRRGLIAGNKHPTLYHVEDVFDSPGSRFLFRIQQLVSLQIKTDHKMEKLRKELAREEGWV